MEKYKEFNDTKMGDLGDETNRVPMQENAADSEHVLKLKKPIKVAGNLVASLEFDFDELTAKDLSKASKYLKNLGIPVSVPALDYDYQTVIFTYAVKKRMDDIEMADLMRLSAADAMAATGVARDFLLGKDPGQKDLFYDES